MDGSSLVQQIPPAEMKNPCSEGCFGGVAFVNSLVEFNATAWVRDESFATLVGKKIGSGEAEEEQPREKSRKKKGKKATTGGELAAAPQGMSILGVDELIFSTDQYGFGHNAEKAAEEERKQKARLEELQSAGSIHSGKKLHRARWRPGLFEKKSKT